jgi:hypothetical protein
MSDAPLSLDESFTRLLGRQPTDSERQKLYEVRDALGLKNNDALWLVLMALQHYQQLYGQMPDAIAAAAAQVLHGFREAADAAAQAAMGSAHQTLTQAVAKAADQVAVHVSKKQMWRWAAACLAVCFVCLTGTGALAFYAGTSQGEANGYRQVRDEKAAAAWANTPQGRQAYWLAQIGTLDRIEQCRQPGWKVSSDGICTPRAASDGKIWGWAVR